MTEIALTPRQRLAKLREQASKASGTFPNNRQLANAQAALARDCLRQADEILDKMVDDLRKAATVVVPVGPADVVERFATLAAKDGALVLDANASYLDLCREMAVRAGVAKVEDGKLVSVTRARQALTADQVGFLIEGSTREWLRRSYYAAKGARSFNQPAPPATFDLFYENLPQLVSRVKAQYAATNRTHEPGKVGLLEALRRHADKSDAVPIMVLVNADLPEERAELPAIFGRKAEVSLPADATRKTLESIWRQATGQEQPKQTTTIKGQKA